MKLGAKWLGRWNKLDKNSKKMLGDEFIEVMKEENVTLEDLDKDMERFYYDIFCKDPMIRKDLYRRIIRLAKTVSK